MDRTRRHVAVVVVAVVIAAVCVALGSWQLRRLEDRRARNAAFVEAGSMPPDFIRHGQRAQDLAPYDRAIVSGEYDVEHEVIVFGRSLDGRPGHHVVTPLVLEDGSAVLVLRGWVPFGMDTAPVEGAEPPAGAVTIRGTAIAAEEGEPPDADGVVRGLDVAAIATALPYRVAPVAVRLREQQPTQRGLPTPVPPPPLSEGPHLSYAIQWFSFGAIALVGAAILLRRDRAATTGGP